MKLVRIAYVLVHGVMPALFFCNEWSISGARKKLDTVMAQSCHSAAESISVI
jgi:hypothetical protein